MHLIKEVIRRILGRFGYAVVNARWPAESENVKQVIAALRQELGQQIAETKSGVSTLQGESRQTLSHVLVMHREVTSLGQEIAETKTGVSTLQEESRQTLSQVLVMHSEVAALGQQIAETKAGVSALQGESGQTLSQIVVMRRERASSGASQAHNVLMLPRALDMLPRALDRLAMQLESNRSAEPGDRKECRGLVQHYAQIADLVSRHWINARQLPDDPYPDDDLTFEYAKRVQAHVAETDVEIEPQQRALPWRPLWFDPDCAVFLVLGDSRAGNHGKSPHSSERELLNLDFLRMRCIKAAAGVGAGSESRASIWSRLGERLIANGLCRRVLFVPLAVPGSRVTDWIPGGPRHVRTALALSRLRKELSSSLLPFSAVLWHPGDAASLSVRAYRLHCHDVIADLRANGVFAPIFVAIGSQHRAASKPNGNDAAIRGALLSLAAPTAGVFIGADLDSIEPDLRVAGRHLSERVLDRSAELWLDVLSASWPLLERPAAIGEPAERTAL